MIPPTTNDTDHLAEFEAFTRRRPSHTAQQIAPHVYLSLDEARQNGYLSIVKHEAGRDVTVRWLLARVSYDKGQERDRTAREKYGEKYWQEYAYDPDEIAERARPPSWLAERFMYQLVPDRAVRADTLEDAVQAWLEAHQRWAAAIARDAELLAPALKEIPQP